MLLLQSKYLESVELAATEKFPASALITVLAGTDTMRLIAKHEVLAQLEDVEPFVDLTLELRARQLDLATLGGRGKAYRLSIIRIIEDEEALA